ncbi:MULTISPECIES: heme exporter protein CcmD [Rahnella]|jgi:heme exporter protein D|uniref:Heme exporter protein D n=1 Tax=Rahnella sp. (strain Y9602) TaxID=2703885 RepID=A0A0H3F9S4_RAHSY|nr:MULTISPECIES: heme exporter protein CcmD [Rahnella]AFE57394.1 heme exporter protein CcmD [Rahnella aquatilis HX2]AYA06155.1 heme exporter protein CcmD [Rahnella aquatilis]ADW72820.1 heme exporter protein CcmD [Rahnella aceris]AZP41387.1 heme exporter protein CcmD [Rahnella aquatilis]AZP45728.1 heme exporter protein CcmD [Rahnella aquatilis]
MSPAFSSWHDFFAMGGYAFYVWLSVAATLLSLVVLVAHTLIQHRQILGDVRRRQAREKRISQSQSKKQPGAQTSPLEPDTSPEKLL